MDTELFPLSETTFLKSLTSINDDIWLKNGFLNLKSVEPSIGIPSLSSLTVPSSAYYFLVASSPYDGSHNKSRNFTGPDSLFLIKNKLSYNNNNPIYSFDVSGNFHALSAYIETLSTNYLGGINLYFNDFEFLTFNSKISGNKNFYFNNLYAEKVFITLLEQLSTVINHYDVPSSYANDVFSSITWDVTAGGSLSAKNILIKENLTSPFVSAKNVYFNNLSAEDFIITNNLSSLSSLYTQHLYGTIQIDPTSPLYYDGNTLSTKLSTVYFFGVKPSDVYSTDNIDILRTLNGAWNSSNVIETLPVLKPYFKNIKQVFDYVKRQGLYGEELNVLIYEDIVQNNVNTDGSTSVAGCSYNGNIIAQHWKTTDPTFPDFLLNAGFKEGEYVWSDDFNTDINGKISYWNVDRLNFSDLNIVGMYNIGQFINISGKAQYTQYKPFNSSPRKISFRTYICNNPDIVRGNWGYTIDDWKLSTKPNSNVFVRPICFNNDEMDVTIQNLCFEFDGSSNNSTCLYFKSGDAYLNNITVAALGSANYAYGAVLAWPKSTVYVCGINQIDPYLLNVTRWNDWTSLPTAKNQAYYPGYGLVIVGNPTSGDLPTLFSDSFIQAWQSKIFFMDYSVNRRIGNRSYLNASIILDGKFSSNAFYELKDNAKLYINNYTFKTNTFSLSNFNANIYDNSSYNGQYINVFQNTNRDNFYYVKFDESNSTLNPHYFEIIEWNFNDANQLVISNINDKNVFTAKFVNEEKPNYIFDTSTKTINVSGMVFGDFQKNLLKEAQYLNDMSYLYNYIDPNNLPIYNTTGLYNLSSPINNSFTYTLNYYSSI